MNDSATHGNFGEIAAMANEAMRPICVQLRKSILSVHKVAFETVWPRLQIVSFGVGPKKMTEHYAYIGAHESHVNLGFYHGANLPDPEALLEGTGKKLRHVKIRSLELAQSHDIRELLKAAVADRFLQRTKRKSQTSR